MKKIMKIFFSLINGSNKYFYTINNENINDILKEHIINKFSKINPKLDFSNLKIEVTKHKSNRIKILFGEKCCKSTTNICQIAINTNRKLQKIFITMELVNQQDVYWNCLYNTI